MGRTPTTHRSLRRGSRWLWWGARGLVVAGWLAAVAVVALAASQPATNEIETATDDVTISRLRTDPPGAEDAGGAETVAAAGTETDAEAGDIPGEASPSCDPADPWCHEPPPVTHLGPPTETPLDSRETEAFTAPRILDFPLEENQLSQEIGVNVFTTTTTTTTPPASAAPTTPSATTPSATTPSATAPSATVADAEAAAPAGPASPAAGAEQAPAIQRGPLARTGLGPITVALALLGLALLGTGLLLRRLARRGA